MIGKFWVNDDSLGTEVEIRDYSNDASVLVFVARYADMFGGAFNLDASKFTMDITSPAHGNTVMYHLIAAYDKIDYDWFVAHGWTQEDIGEYYD